MSVKLDTEVGEVNLKDMNLLFYFQIKSLNSSSLLKNIPYDNDFLRKANF